MNAMNQVNRREFLTKAAAVSAMAAGPWILPGRACGADGGVAPSNRINIGLIGRGAMGRVHLRWLANNSAVHVPALCDVDQLRCEEGKRLIENAYAKEKASGVYRGCAALNDYQDMLAKPDIDAVLIATPDHWHALASIDAAKAGKDVYCEKPVSLTLDEGRQLVAAVRRNGRVFQTGTQYRSIPVINKIVKFIRDGGLGKIKSVFVHWGWVHVETVGDSRFPMNPSLREEPVPAGLDWNRWVGPAAWHPYNRSYHRNPIPGVVPWVFCEDFGAGPSTSFHAHSADVIHYAIGMEESGPVEIIHPESGLYPTLTCKYANGVLVHHLDHISQAKDIYKAVPDSARLEGNFGGIIVGERGWVTTMSAGGPAVGGPDSLFQEMRIDTKDVGRGPAGANNHYANWLECIRNRGKPSSHEEIGHRSASLGHLVALSFRLGRSLKWDPVKESFLGDEEANRLRSRALREPWRI